MARAISVRLDEAAERALRSLMRNGRSRSEAIREALVETATRRRARHLAAEARRVAADPQDRAEMAELLEFMEGLDDPR
jgi:Arc/MetJ-type ribon-helix-helix transcriptional regulator